MAHLTISKKNGQHIRVPIQVGESIKELKAYIYKKHRIPVNEQEVIVNGLVKDDAYRIQANDVENCSLRLKSSQSGFSQNQKHTRRVSRAHLPTRSIQQQTNSALLDETAHLIIIKKNECIQVPIQEGVSIRELKTYIEHLHGIPVAKQEIIVNGHVRNDAYRIQTDDMESCRFQLKSPQNGPSQGQNSTRVITDHLPRSIQPAPLQQSLDEIDKRINILKTVKNQFINEGKLEKYHFFLDLIEKLENLKREMRQGRAKGGDIDERIKLIVKDLAQPSNYRSMGKVVTTSWRSWMGKKTRSEQALIDVLGKGKKGEQALKDIMKKKIDKIEEEPAAPSHLRFRNTHR